MLHRLIRRLPAVMLGLLLSAPLLAAGYQNLDRIVAVVDDSVIVQSELDAEIRRVVLQLQEQGAPAPPRRVLNEQVLERLILQRLQLNAAEKANIKLSDEMLAEAVQNLAQGNNLSIAELREVLEADGISFRQFRDGIREQLVTKRLIETEVARNIQVSDREIEAYLERQQAGDSDTLYHLKHILIALPDGASPEEVQAARAEIEGLMGQVREGVRFEGLAIEHSDGQHALEGGDLGWRRREQIPSIFADLIAGLQEGEIAGPVRSASGFHIIQLAEKRGGERLVITQTHARHILIRPNEITADQDARTRLVRLRQRIEGGDDFGNLARSHSDDEGSAIRGGDLGWITPGDTVPEFEAAMNELRPGEISAPFRTDFGWHIVQVLERRRHDSTEEIKRSQARKTLREKKLEEETELYLRRLRDEAFVEIRLDEGL